MFRSKFLNILRLFIIFTFILNITNSSAGGDKFQPKWWFGLSSGANFNFYSSGIQSLNASQSLLPVKFEKGSGVGLFLSPLLEYRPDPVWGGMLTIGFDGRGGSFDDMTSNNINYKLSTSMNYISIEPSLRVAPFDFGLYFFAGPRLGFNVAKSFTYDTTAGIVENDWNEIRGTVFGGQIGAGYDLPLTSPDAKWQINLSPYLAAHFGQGPRTVEKWSLTTLRLGAALKFGSTTEIKKELEEKVDFSVRSPKIIPSERKVKETFPVRNYIFFDGHSKEIPKRYIQLLKDRASNFKEDHLLEAKPADLTGRSSRQLSVYYNTMNIIGDRLRRSPNSKITLTGSSDKGIMEGKEFAESVKKYLVDVFGIESFRINVEGREKPAIPSVQPGGTRELDLVKPEDRRVEITSSSLELLEPVQIISLQEDPLDSDVIFNASGAEQTLVSWTVEIKDAAGKTNNYGPFTADRERISGKNILGTRDDGRFQVVMVGQTKAGQTLRKEETIRLVKSDKPEEDMGLRFSILFEFDQSKTVATYDRFLSNVVAPLIPEGGSVIIHGHTDIVGEESYNLKLSRNRAQETMQVLERELAKAGKKRVKFDTYGFGEDIRRAPFENILPEERFYNRTVIVDIVPE